MNSMLTLRTCSRLPTTLLLLCCLLPLPAFSQQQSAERSWHLGLALGQGERSNPLVGGEDIDIHYVIDFSWYGDRLFFDNGDLGYTLLTARNLSLSALVTLNNERNYYNYLTGQQFGLQSIFDKGFIASIPVAPEAGVPKDELTNSAHTTPEAIYNNQHTELADRDSALNGGFEFLYISPYGDVQAQVLSDVSGTHDGQEAWLSWSHPWYTRNTELSLTLGLEWKSEQLVGYYFGVQPDESFVGRPTYEGAAGTNSFVRLAGRYNVSAHWTVVGMVEREFLSSAISASPIVNADAVDTFFTGLFYQF
ncbi:MAG: MipA/OmpV family protein [Pseudomonadota bacterium]